MPRSKHYKEVINGIEVSTPKRPMTKNIYGNQLSKKEQKWCRTPLPDNWEFLPSKERDSFIKQEYQRRIEGYWFMNKGKATYISGKHYFYINWCKIDIGYPDYRDRDRRFFMFWDFIEKDPDSYGMIMVKHRREGASWKGACMNLETITSHPNAHGGFLSKTGADAKDLFQKAVFMFRRLPDFFQPIIEGTDNPKTVLSFSQTGQRITKKHQKVQKSQALDSKIDWRNTSDNSYDSTKLKFFMSDEAGKWEEANVAKNWQIVKPTLSLGNKIYGKAFLPSTVNEMTRAGGKVYKEIWDDSNPNEKDANGRTRSGLYRYFTPAYDGLEGFIDEWGYSQIKEGKQYLKNIRDSLKRDTNKLAEHKRQFPWSPEEAFRVDSKNCIFDSERISQQLDWLETLNRPLTVRGNFQWLGGLKDSKVVWHPDSNGKWLMAWKPEDEFCNRKTDQGKVNRPFNESSLVAGCDPFDHDTTTDGRRSDAAAYVFKKYTPADPNNSHLFVCEYIARPPKSTIFYEDMLMQSVFYGCQILVENQKIGCINWFNQRGYSNYLMDRPESTHLTSSRTQKSKGVPMSAALANAISDVTQAYVYDAVGINEHTDEIGKCFFPNLLKDWLEYEPDNRTKYDATVAAGLTLLASQKHIIKTKVHKPVVFVRTYNNSGPISKQINL